MPRRGVLASSRRSFRPSAAENPMKRTLDDHWRRGRAPELQVVPVATWPAGDGSCPRLLRANPRLGWNGIALSPPMGRPRASVVDKPRPRQAWKRPALVLPDRQL